jgi:hypothetical protein
MLEMRAVVLCRYCSDMCRHCMLYFFQREVMIMSRNKRVTIADVVSTAAQIHGKPGHWSFLPPWKSPACQRSFQFPTGYWLRSRFSSKPGWNVALEASEEPHHLTCMLTCIRAWPAFIGVSLQQAFPIRDLPGQGVDHHFSHSARLGLVVSFSLANATRDKTSDAY